jgi:hypothetical protein
VGRNHTCPPKQARCAARQKAGHVTHTAGKKRI